MSCYSIRPTMTSALPRLLPDPLLDRIDAIQRADPWAHEDALDEGGIDGYADSPPLTEATARSTPPLSDAGDTDAGVSSIEEPSHVAQAV